LLPLLALACATPRNQPVAAGDDGASPPAGKDSGPPVTADVGGSNPGRADAPPGPPTPTPDGGPPVSRDLAAPADLPPAVVMADAAMAPADAGACSNVCCGGDPLLDSDRSGVADCMESLLPNGQFKRDLAGWAPYPSDGTAAFEWTASDARGDSTSGAVKVTNRYKNPPFSVWGGGIADCLPATGGAAYRASADYFIPTGQEPLGRAYIDIEWQSTADCSQYLAPAASFDLPITAGVWSRAERMLTSPPGAVAVRFRLDAAKSMDAPFVVLFDNVLFVKR
jgi:hypothetical protein